MNHPCVKCGYCCSKGPCSYGEWANDKCIFLVVDDPEKGTFVCSKYKQIKEFEKRSQYPMFDCGCSSAMFNDIRANVIMRRDNDSP